MNLQIKKSMIDLSETPEQIKKALFKFYKIRCDGTPNGHLNVQLANKCCKHTLELMLLVCSKETAWETHKTLTDTLELFKIKM